jgi:hypothetical protein
MMMNSQLEIASLFSSGKFDRVAGQLSDEVGFHIYEDDKHLIGKPAVLEFCKGISGYFASIETDFRESGHVAQDGKVVIYGYGEFKKDGVLLNAVHSCDVYEFDSLGRLVKIQAYCNSQKK